MRHEIKIRIDFANAVLSGEKTFELRRNDRGYQRGDTVVFRVVDREGNEMPEHPISGKTYIITYVLSGWGMQKNFCAFSITPAAK